MAGANDAIGAFEHEISEVLGRLGWLGSYFDQGKTNTYGIIDLFRYSPSGTIDTSANAYFSVDKGKTLLTQFNDPTKGGDVADWVTTLPGDSFGSNYRGMAATVTQTDLTVMDVLGFNMASTKALPTLPTVQVHDVSLNAQSSILASSLISSISIPTGDSVTFYAFWDGGTGNGHFTLNGITQADGKWIVVDSANMGSVKYTAGSVAGSETLYVDVFDATQNVWSAASSLTATTTSGPTLGSTSTYPSAAVTAVVTGLAPTQAEYVTRADFAQNQYNYYANVLKVAHPELGPYETLGVAFSSVASFTSRYGPAVDTTSTAFVNHAYLDIFKIAPSSLQQTQFLSQLTFMTNLYQSAGIASGTAQLQARGAVLGQMIGIVMTDASLSSLPNYTLDDQVISFVSKVAAGNTSVFGQPWSTASTSASSASSTQQLAVNVVGLHDSHSDAFT